MEPKALTDLILAIIKAVEQHVAEYLAIEADRARNNGNSAVCILDAAGNVHGKMFGPDKIRQRHLFRIAWTKASQVWITGIKTGEYEKLVYTGQIDEDRYGIIRPDFIGWEGGQPIVLKGQIKLAAGFSGFRGTSDLEIVQKAVADVTGQR